MGFREERFRQHVLILDESAAQLELLDILLREEGFSVTTSSVLPASVDDTLSFRPDAIVVDFFWKEDDRGMSFMNQLRNDPRTVGLPIVLCTTGIQEATMLASDLDAHRIKVVIKPFDLDELVGSLRLALYP